MAVALATVAWRCGPRLSPFIATAAIVAAAVAAGALAATPPAATLLSDHPNGLTGPWRVRGRLATDPQGIVPHSLVDLRVEQIRVDGVWEAWPLRVRVTVYEPASNLWKAADRFEAFLSLRADRPAANPLVPARPPLRASGADLRSSLKSYRQLRRLPTEGLPSPRRLLAPARHWIREASRLFGDDAPLVRALTLGERGDLGTNLQHRFARTGLVHLLAISGLHVGLLVAALFVVARVAGAPRPAAALVCLAALPVVHAMVLPRAAVARALLMAATLLVATVAGRRPDAVNGLALASILLAAADPWVTRNLGYQLSTAATAAILVMAGGAAPTTWRNALPRAFCVSAAAQIGVAPTLAATSLRIPLAALLLNPLAVPLLGLGLAAALGGLLATALGGHGLAAPWVTAAQWAFAGLRGLSFQADALSFWLLIQRHEIAVVTAATVAAFALFVAARALESRRLLAVGVALTSACALVGWTSLRRPTTPGASTMPMRLVVLDVGQGDALLVEPPGGDAVLVDAGGSPGSSFDTGVSIVAPALRARGTGRLGAVAITHFHADHAGGLHGLLGEASVAAVWTASVAPTTAAVQRLLEAPWGAPIVGLKAGHERRTPHCQWSVLHPSDSFVARGGGPPANDFSLVLQVRCAGRRLVLSGDIEAAAERSWAATSLPGRRFTDGGVLKVPHHGSATSSSDAFLDALPGIRHAAISAGWRNRFGLPDPQVSERYRNRQIALYRTDRDGALTFTLGRRIRVKGERWSSGRGRPVVGGWLH